MTNSKITEKDYFSYLKNIEFIKKIEEYKNIKIGKINDFIGSGEIIIFSFDCEYECIIFKNVSTKYYVNYNRLFSSHNDILECSFCTEGEYKLNINFSNKSHCLNKNKFCIFYMPEKYKNFKMIYNNFSSFSIVSKFNFLSKKKNNTPFNKNIIKGLISNSKNFYIDNFLLIDSYNKTMNKYLNFLIHKNFESLSLIKDELINIYKSSQLNKVFFETSVMTGIINLITNNLDSPPCLKNLNHEFDISSYKIQKYFNQYLKTSFYKIKKSGKSQNFIKK
jgi:hypothetical protein